MITEEIRKRLIDPFKETGLSDEKWMRIATSIAKKHNVTVEDVFKIYDLLWERSMQ